MIDRLWDHGHVEWALQDFDHHEAALLNGPGHETFVVLARPLHHGQFLVAALTPPGIDAALRTSPAPHGIAVPGVPARAAAALERRLLPRYRQAVEAVRAPALREAHRLAKAALADWDAVSDSLCDAAGMPLDENTYGIRQARRDAEAWRPFEVFLCHGPAAIDHAKAVLPTLPLPASATARWNYQLRLLTGALTEGIRIRDDYEPHLAPLLTDRDNPERWTALNERNAESWDAITVVIEHAPVLHAIEDAERKQAEFTAVRAAARARSTTATPAPRTGPRLPTPEAPTPPPGPPTRPRPPGR